MLLVDLQFISLVTLISGISSNAITFQFGKTNVSMEARACYVQGVLKNDRGTFMSTHFFCEANSPKVISGVKVFLDGLPNLLGGGTKLEKKLGGENVTVHIWGGRSQSLNYKIWVFEDEVKDDVDVKTLDTYSESMNAMIYN